MAMINAKNSNQSFFISLLSFIPIFVFVIYARVKELLGSCNVGWQEPFYIGALLAIALTTLQYMSGLILDRLMMGANLFLIASASFFLFQINPCLSFLGGYKGPSFILAVLLVGIYSTFFTRHGFVGCTGDHHKIRHASLLLLIATLAALAWAFIFNSHGLLVSAIAPFITLRILSEYLKNGIQKRA
jgi:hypothetical protein